ncbi:uncharacterized protein LOC143204061 [Rhynchophorus ferrugineus]|uniref:uncharacterized protein LOC143204061 n=1 Tax=Rhynchophorus ferrugineus TaxID=354439 RepID=UPI003FCDAC1C
MPAPSGLNQGCLITDISFHQVPNSTPLENNIGALVIDSMQFVVAYQRLFRRYTPTSIDCLHGEVNLSMSSLPRDNSDSSNISAQFNQYKTEKYPEHLFIFSDGSKNNDYVGQYLHR